MGLRLEIKEQWLHFSGITERNRITGTNLEYNLHVNTQYLQINMWPSFPPNNNVCLERSRDVELNSQCHATEISTIGRKFRGVPG